MGSEGLASELRWVWLPPSALFMLPYAKPPPTSPGFEENYRAAGKAFEEALKLKPDWPEANNEVGRRLPDGKGIEFLKKAIRLKPELADAHQNLGVAYLYTSKYREAVDCFLETIRLEPDRARAHKLLGLAYLVTDQREKAMAQYQILKSLDHEMADDLNAAICSPNKPKFGVEQGSLISVPKPKYPAAARKLGIVGDVIVEVSIDTKGRVTHARAISGPLELRGASESAALKARFEPTKLSGKPVAIKGRITFHFRP